MFRFIFKCLQGNCRTVPRSIVDDYHIDSMTTHLVRRAKEFNVIVPENMFSAILSDLAGELVGELRFSSIY